MDGKFAVVDAVKDDTWTQGALRSFYGRHGLQVSDFKKIDNIFGASPREAILFARGNDMTYLMFLSQTKIDAAKNVGISPATCIVTTAAIREGKPLAPEDYLWLMRKIDAEC